jgi:plasmid maintenance system antidote protein VapI
VQANIVSVGYRKSTTFPVNGTTYRLTNLQSGKVLDAVSCGLALGTGAQLWQSLGHTCQQWAVIPAGNGCYELVVENSGMVLDDLNCGTANGTKAQLWMWLNNTCQLWSITP